MVYIEYEELLFDDYKELCSFLKCKICTLRRTIEELEEKIKIMEKSK